MAPKSAAAGAAKVANKAVETEAPKVMKTKPAKSGSESDTNSDKQKKVRVTQAVKLQNAIRAAIEKLNEEKFSKALDILQKAVEVKERKPNAYNEFVAKHMKEVLANLKKDDPNADRTQCMAIIGNMWKKQKETETGSGSKSDDETKATKTKAPAKKKATSDTETSDAEKPKAKPKPKGKAAAKKPEPIPEPEPETDSDSDDSDSDEDDE